MKTTIINILSIVIFCGSSFIANAGMIPNTTLNYTFHETTDSNIGAPLTDHLGLTISYVGNGQINCSFFSTYTDGINNGAGKMVDLFITIPNMGALIDVVKIANPEQTIDVTENMTTIALVEHKGSQAVASSAFSWTMNFNNTTGTKTDADYLNDWAAFTSQGFSMTTHLLALVDGKSAKIASTLVVPGTEIQTPQDSSSTTPEPATMLIFGLGMLGAGFTARKRFSSK